MLEQMDDERLALLSSGLVFSSFSPVKGILCNDSNVTPSVASSLYVCFKA